MTVEIEGYGWVTPYIESRQPMDTFLQDHFRFTDRNTHNASKIEFDIKRNGRTIAIPVRNYQGGNLNKMTEFKGMEITPPGYNEGFVITGEMLQKRMPGQLPSEVDDVTFAAAVADIMMDHFDLCDSKIVGGLELQAAQIFQTGKLNIKDEGGTDDVYEFDFLPKATHFATVGTLWTAADSDPLTDLETYIRLTARDGKCSPNKIVMGHSASNAFFKNAEVKSQLDNRRISRGELAPRPKSEGSAAYQGTFTLGGFNVDIWVYDGYYEATAGGDQKEFLDPTKVIIMDDRAVFVRESCAVPFVAAPEARVTALIPSRVTRTENGVDFTPNAWFANDRKSVTASLEARTVLIPKQIDAFSCIKVVA